MYDFIKAALEEEIIGKISKVIKKRMEKRKTKNEQFYQNCEMARMHNNFKSAWLTNPIKREQKPSQNKCNLQKEEKRRLYKHKLRRSRGKHSK